MLNAVTSDCWNLFPWGIFFSVLSFTWGACIGSFLNVCIYRIPRELSVVAPRSFCPHCNKPVPWYLNIPLLSYVMLRGKCRYCSNGISPRYFLVELLTAMLFLVIWLQFAKTPVAQTLRLVPVDDWKLVPVYWLVVSGLILGTFVDFEHLIIPDRVTLGGIAAGLVFSILVPSLHGETSVLRSLMWSAIGVVAGAGSLWLMAMLGKLIFRKDAMGMGDVKLLGAIGAFLGTTSVALTILLSSLAGTVVGVTLIALQKKSLQSRIPYGPYLALAAVVWILWGPNLVGWYLAFVMPAGVQLP
jgi:leader peptidase (prepilin peptidase)/N-methyltransferase